MTKLEEVARAIAEANGDEWEDVPEHKGAWNYHRGMFGGRARDVNEPFRDDYLDMARAALAALREPSEAMWDRGETVSYEIERITAYDEAQAYKYPTARVYRLVRIYTAMIDAAVEEE